MLIEFEQNTLANMTAALEYVCKQLAPDRDSSEARKQIADAIIACARSGRRNYADFREVGLDTLAEITKPRRTGWLGRLGL